MEIIYCINLKSEIEDGEFDLKAFDTIVTITDETDRRPTDGAGTRSAQGCLLVLFILVTRRG